MIETERLVLREWTEADLVPFSQINSDAEVMEHFPRMLSYDESVEFYKRITGEFAECGWGLFAVELKETGEFIGYTGFHRFDFDAEFSPGVEIGWRLARRHWGNGYATEAAKACIEYASERRLAARLYSFTAVCNVRSRRVMQKAGLEYAGNFMHPALPDGHRLKEHVLYRIEL